WGVRAGNGVIVITTKRGQPRQPMTITFNANTTVRDRPDLFQLPVISTPEYIDLETYLFERGYYDADISNTTSWPALTPVVELLALCRDGLMSQEETLPSYRARR